jgi:hypothetical protein
MKTIYISNSDEDTNDGLSRQTPIFSWKRAKALAGGNSEMHLMEGPATFERLTAKIQSEEGPDALFVTDR